MRTQGNIGVRVVETKTDGVGGLSIGDTPDEEDIIVPNFSGLNQSYTEVLPSFNMTFAPDNPNAGWLVRTAISKVLTRPTVGEMNPNWEVNYADAEIERGNPTLSPFTAWQFDLGFEYYFGDNNEGLFSIAGFTKDVDDFIAGTTFTETHDFGVGGLAPQEYQVETFKNVCDAKIDGIEMSWQTPFTWLPGIWSDFGAMVNYTFIDSEFTDEDGNSNPFPGTSENTVNVVAFYEKEGFSTRVAYNFRDDYLFDFNGPSNGLNHNEFVEGSGRVDIGVRYRWENGFKIALDLINVTEEQRYIYFDVTDRLEDFTNEGMTTNLSFGYKF